MVRAGAPGLELGTRDTPVVEVVGQPAGLIAAALGGAVGMLDRDLVAVLEIVGTEVASHGWSMQRGYDKKG